MELNKEIIVGRLKAIKTELEDNFGLTEIALFGSYARDEQNQDSDIDLLVLEKRGSYKNYLNLYVKLESLFPEKKVEMVSKRGVKERYFEAIKPELIYA